MVVISDSMLDTEIEVAEPKLYTPLANKGSIRLLHLEDGASPWAVPLKTKLTFAGIHQVLPWRSYSALSYVWGEELPSVTIYCNGLQVIVGQNLCCALRRIWQNSPRQILWADALCINQSDHEEKSAQVQMMGKIFQRAESVIVWLGDDEGSHDWCAREDESANTHKLEYFAHGLRESHWLSRQWTLEEIVLAPRAVVMRGTKWVDWKDLSHYVLMSPPEETQALHEAIELIENLRLRTLLPQVILDRDNAATSSSRPWRDYDLTDLILATRNRRCYEAHDKVYGLMAIAPQHKDSLPAVDYELPVWELYAQIASTVLQIDGRVDLLHGAGIIPRHENQATWVTDLRSRSALSAAKRFSNEKYTSLVSTKPPVDPSECFAWNQEEPKKLHIRGWLLGVLRRQGSCSATPEALQLMALPRCFCHSKFGFSAGASTDAGIVAVKLTPKSTSTCLAADILADFRSHKVSDCAACQKHVSTWTHKYSDQDARGVQPIETARIDDTSHRNEPLARFSSDFFNNDFARKVCEDDVFCDLPCTGGLCVLRPIPGGHFKLVCTSALFEARPGEVRTKVRNSIVSGEGGCWTCRAPIAFARFVLV